jgi:hypothetical protein
MTASSTYALGAWQGFRSDHTPGITRTHRKHRTTSKATELARETINETNANIILNRRFLRKLLYLQKNRADAEGSTVEETTKQCR